MAKSKSVRININMPDDVLNKVDTCADSLGLSRSACLTMIASVYFQQQEAMTALGSIANQLATFQKNEPNGGQTV